MTTRITGMVSGLDIDSLVTAGVASYQLKLDQANQQQQIDEWKQQQYRAISTSVSTFFNKYLDPTSSSSLLMSNNWITTSFASSDSTSGNSTTSVTATATSSSATPANYEVNVSQLASATTAQYSLNDLVAGNTIIINNGKSIPLTGSSPTAIIQNLNSSLANSGISATYSDFANNGAGGLVLTNNTMGTTDITSNISGTDTSGHSISGVGPAKYTQGTYLNATISNGSNTYTIDDSDAVTTNTKTLDGVQFNFASITNTTSQSTSNITDSSITSSAFYSGKTTNEDNSTTYTLTDGSTITLASGGTVTQMIDKNGKNCEAIAITSTDGTKKTTFSSDGNMTTTGLDPAKITGTTNTTTLQNNIQSFMGDYNTLLTTINGKIYENHDADYPPLTDSQKSSMSDTDITTWNTQAQTGLLQNDSYLESLSSDMKQAMSSFMKSTDLDLEGIGITPVADYQSANGTYSVDSNALQSALNGGLTKNGSTVTIAEIQSLFTNTSSSSTATQSTTGDGVLSQLKVALNNNVMNSGSQFQQVAGVVGTTSEYTNEITLQLQDETTNISTLTDQLNTQENALYQKYANMETQLNNIDSSSSLFGSSGS